MEILKPAYPQILKRKESLLFLVIFISGVSLFGWLVGSIVFASFSPIYIPIAPLTAAMFIVLCILSLVKINSARSRFTSSVATPSVILIALICLFIFLDYLFNFHLDIENIFVKSPERLGNIPVGRMSPITSLLFVFSCVSVLSIKRNNAGTTVYIGGGLALAAFFVSSILLIGYLYKAPLLYGGQTIPVALPTAICFLLFSITLLRVPELQFWASSPIYKNPAVIRLSKAFLPLVVSIVILQGFLITNFSINQDNPALTSALILIIVVAITIYVVMRVSAILGDKLMRAEKKLRESEELSRSLLHTIPFGMDIVDENGNILFLGENLKAYFGDEAIGKKCWQLYRDDKKQCASCPLKAGINIGETEDNESSGVLGGKTFEVVHTGMMFEGKKAILEIFIDITGRKRAENEIKLKNEELQKINAEKDKFFSIIAHDLKNPFNTIIGFSDLLAEEVMGKNFDGIAEYAGIIRQSSHRAMGLLMNLMEWSQSQTGKMEFSPEFFNLADIVDEIALLLSDGAGLKTIIIKLDLPGKVPVYADKAMVSTILRNLVSNAIKFTKPGGEIIISAVEDVGVLTVSVSDTGVGIPKDALDKLFRIDKSYSTPGTQNEKGTGLGLILCKDFLEKHGGKIWVESQVGNGSTFYFTIPSQSGLEKITAGDR